MASIFETDRFYGGVDHWPTRGVTALVAHSEEPKRQPENTKGDDDFR